ncbi:TSC22 domain family protein 2 [Rhinatrema bivittatum]|uniref:TSC22 domain family protein 2 n=1 Tax=Rhinatrema bivittatum TaxID=194408 RepID=UPI00112AD21C|nr:TSC22 domain family protein 2 [Rhinatrema bivittatum]XP_029471983.1 TSC22 domain family protein 2 [Rhinatrema bivittatum]XP_029471984.1 TSC22 domain family protein 2 [Rhinatrema bivittatum]XP_029471985.1 TSC22 domain family protein 2 [Rhinatrema bivittatum]
MSKMPAKKKSCFQITSVTTAQVASSITEDTESLDDPDESRTEDVSSEIFDVSRATDYGPEDVVERSSSEETLNNVGDAETPGTVSPNVLQDGQVAAISRSSVVAGPSALSNVLSQPPGIAAQIPSSAPGGSIGQSAGCSGPSNVGVVTSQSTTAMATCGSRFRVIKLDHGTGEPYRRGRWTCTEFYDRDSDNTIITRTGDTIRHTSTFDQAAERDSGLGATGGSVLVSAVHTGHGLESLADSSLTAVSQLLQTEKMSQPSQQQQHFVIGQQPLGGVLSQSTTQPMYSGSAVTSQQMMAPQQQSLSQVNAHNIVQTGHNGKGTPPQNVATQSTMSVPQQQVQHTNASVTQTQQFVYSQPQITPVHFMPTQPSGQTEYMQHMTVMPSQAGSVIPATGLSSLPVSHVSGQNPSLGGAQMIAVPPQSSEAVGQGSGLMQSGQTATSQPVVIQQPGGVVHTGLVQQKSLTQHQMGGSSQVSGMPSSPHPMVSGVQNVPVVVPGTSIPAVSSSVPTVSTTPVTMPNVPVTLGQSQPSSHTPVSRSTSLIQPIGLPVMQGTTNVHTSLPQSVSQFQTQNPLHGHIEDRRKSEPLPQPPLSLITDNKPFMKPPVVDTLTNPLHLPVTTPMNTLASSVFGISIPVDGDEDSASGASVVAIDNKIEQAMDLVKSHLMYAVREEVEVLKEQIKELIERNCTLERENALLKSLANSEQLSQLPAQQTTPSSTSQQPTVIAQPPQTAPPPQQPNVSSA